MARAHGLRAWLLPIGLKLHSAGTLSALSHGEGTFLLIQSLLVHLSLPCGRAGAVLAGVGILLDKPFHFLVIFCFVGLVDLRHPSLQPLLVIEFLVLFGLGNGLILRGGGGFIAFCGVKHQGS